MSFNDSLESGVLNWFFKNASPTVAQISTSSSIGIGLAGAAPNENGTVTSQRGGTLSHAISTYWGSNASGGAISNTTKTLLWEPSSAWGSVTHIFFADPSAGSTSKIYGSVSPTYTVVPDTFFGFEIGDITITLGGFNTTNCRNLWLNNVVRKSGTAGLANQYFGLSTVTTVDTATFVEPTGGNYSRAAVTSSVWGAITFVGGFATMPTDEIINFPVATALWQASGQTTVKSWGILNHPTNAASTALMAFGTLTTPLTINADDQPFFNSGDLTLTLT